LAGHATLASRLLGPSQGHAHQIKRPRAININKNHTKIANRKVQPAKMIMEIAHKQVHQIKCTQLKLQRTTKRIKPSRKTPSYDMRLFLYPTDKTESIHIEL